MPVSEASESSAGGGCWFELRFYVAACLPYLPLYAARLRFLHSALLCILADAAAADADADAAACINAANVNVP